MTSGCDLDSVACELDSILTSACTAAAAPILGPAGCFFGGYKGVFNRRLTSRKSKGSGITPWLYRIRLVLLKCRALIRPEGEMSTRDSIRFGKKEVKPAEIPPPREYPTMENLLGPVHDKGDDASTSKICVVKSLRS